MKKKITTIFETAYKRGHDSLVLSALGCGAFRCPAKGIAEIFNEVIQEYDGYFNVILFAIYPGNNNLEIKQSKTKTLVK